MMLHCGCIEKQHIDLTKNDDAIILGKLDMECVCVCVRARQRPGENQIFLFYYCKLMQES